MVILLQGDDITDPVSSTFDEMFGDPCWSRNRDVCLALALVVYIDIMVIYDVFVACYGSVVL